MRVYRVLLAVQADVAALYRHWCVRLYVCAVWDGPRQPRRAAGKTRLHRAGGGGAELGQW